LEWLQRDMHGTMDWMARPDALEKRADPRRILPDAKSIVVLAFRYTPPEIPAELLNDPSRGIIARYALYDDYHKVIGRKLEALAHDLEQSLGSFSWKGYVDTGPVLEREWAQTSGLGFIGRNANLINYQLGSYVFLCELIVSAELPVVRTRRIGSCGTCHRCGDACPTGAIVADRTIDARKCISYLTIEHRGAIPEWIRPLMKNRIYGCDICQEVCPWNGKPTAQIAQQKTDFQVRPDLVAPKLETLLFFDDESFRERFQKSPIKRAKREGFMRNVAIAVGNWGTADARTLLVEIIANDPSPLVREHAEWYTTRI
jgi:epoxyqueuosine reductase